MKKHVADLDHSKALVNAGIVVDTYFLWTKTYVDSLPVNDWILVPKHTVSVMPFDVPAPLPCELMEILNEQETAYVARAFTAVTNRLVQCPFNTTLKLITANMLCDMLLWMKGQWLLEQPEGTEGEG